MRTACGTTCSFCHSSLSSSLAPSCGGGGGKVAVLWFLNDLLLHRSLYWCLHDLSHHLPKVMHRSPSPVAHKSFVFFKSNILSFYETTHIIISRNYLSTAGGEIRATPFPSFVRIRHRKKRNRGKSQTPSALSLSLSLSLFACLRAFFSLRFVSMSWVLPVDIPAMSRLFFPNAADRCETSARAFPRKIHRKKKALAFCLSFFLLCARAKAGGALAPPKNKETLCFFL